MTKEIKTIPSSLLAGMEVEQLYHISFNGSLKGLWDPAFNQKPDDNHPVEPVAAEDQWYPEPNLPRISVAETIEGCFRAIYPNVSKFFEERKYPNMHFSVYSPVFKGSERIVTPGLLTSERMVWDAFVTGEYLILDKVYMQLVGKIKDDNTNKSPTKMVHPFNDKKEPLASVGPETIKWHWTQRTLLKEV